MAVDHDFEGNRELFCIIHPCAHGVARTVKAYAKDDGSILILSRNAGEEETVREVKSWTELEAVAVREARRAAAAYVSWKSREITLRIRGI